jgi:hypothetical protein
MRVVMIPDFIEPSRELTELTYAVYSSLEHAAREITTLLL